jgi:mRNA interferase RelE/StbE
MKKTEYVVQWKKKAFKQLMALQLVHRKAITGATAELKNWPTCRNVIALNNHQYHYRLRVGRYRVFFDVDTEIKIVHIEEVKKRDEHTYQG